jgi:serine-type D-Ala-D-Ala carboxypeptidase/endopeptidase (penicillin-binding protein 4)
VRFLRGWYPIIRSSIAAVQPAGDLGGSLTCHIMSGLSPLRAYRFDSSRPFVHLQRGVIALCLLLLFLFAQIAIAQAKHSEHPASIPKTARPDAAVFRARVLEILRTSNSERAFWGMLIADRDTGAILCEMNSDHFFTPASNAKLFTTALALGTLGPDSRFHTTLESKATLASDGRLPGDLVLVGRGDPDLSNRKIPYTIAPEREGIAEKILAEMADAAVAAGLREVDGNIVADDSYFPYDPYPAGWGVGDLFFRFGAPVSAIAFNDNSVTVDVLPAHRIGDSASVLTQPVTALDSFRYQITTSPADTEPDLAVVRQPGEKFILLRGAIPFEHKAVTLDLAMPEPAEAAAVALRQLLQERGVRVMGGVQVRHAPPPETSASGEPILTGVTQSEMDSNRRVLAEHISQPLLETVRITNKVSQNLYAELLLRAVGRFKLGLGSTAAGLKVEREFLHQAGIADGDVLLSDGSGLARDDLVTPRAVVVLLEYVLRQPWGLDYISTLPVAGVDGTLQNRMVNTVASNRIQAKTGEIEHARGLSGYATTLRGERLIFSIFYNNNPQKGVESSAPIDAIVTAMVETLGTGRVTPKHP